MDVMSGRTIENSTRDRAAELLAGGATIDETADVVGTASTTILRWQRDAEFREQIDHRRADLWDAEQARLRGLVGKAIDVLGAGLSSPSERIRIECSRQVLRSVGLFKTTSSAGDIAEEKWKWMTSMMEGVTISGHS
jgi:hypothetical protein